MPIVEKKVVIKQNGERKRNRRKIKAEMVRYIISVLVVLLVISIGAVVLLFQSRMANIQKLADNAVPELWVAEDGTYELSLRSLEGVGADYYYVNVSTHTIGGGHNRQTYYSGYADGFSCRLPGLPADETYVLQIDLYKKKSMLGKEVPYKLASIERFFYIRDPMIDNLEWEVDPDAGSVSVRFDFRGSNCCGVYVTNADGRKLVKVLDENSVELWLEEEKELWIPTPGNPCTLTFVPGYNVNDMALYSGESKEMTVTWEDFAARDIHLSLDVTDGCVCYLEWDELDCDSYEIQMMDGDVGVWETVKTAAQNDERIYASPRLSPGAGYSFRVAAVAGDYAAISEVRECEIAVTPMYCTVWPVKNLKAYSDAAKSEAVGEVKVLDAYCVVAVENDMFGINMDGRICYIDSNYCMINLPEYVGALCSYDITNSYDSVFMAHGFEIPGLTGEVIPGYEDVRLNDNGFLVPLLYPAAKKLETAIATARERGYRLKIYDAFRPHEASVYMYQTALQVQYAPLPGEELPADLYVTVEDENGGSTKRRKTYIELMSGNTAFTLGAFLNSGISRHNLGVAMDLTLENLYTGDEVVMQTAMHDLSHYSAPSGNMEYARELAAIMTSAGYIGLSSEWWHFQDDVSKNRLSLPCVNKGVTPECWMANGFGWRYRGVDGTYAADCTLTIDGKEHTFDSDGYLQE